MIEPTVGRIVWLYNAPEGLISSLRQPFAASVAYVFDSRLINVGYIDHIGRSYSLCGVTLLQDDDLKPEGKPFCCWMPYQKGQAVKYEKEKS